jgi:hypothetical protein
VALLDVFDLSAVYARLIKFLGPIGKVIDAAVSAVKRLGTIVQRQTKLMDDAVKEFKEWRNFKEDIRFKSRVVNLEVAFIKTKALIEGIPAAWHSIIDIVQEFRKKVDINAEVTEVRTEISTEIEEGSGEIITKLLNRFPKLLKGLERAAVVLGLILDSLETLSKVIDDLQTVLDEITRVRLEIERLDTIFLSQGNKRKRVKLADGRTVNFRLGKLHAAGL